ncbi:hypothetical protein J2X31_002202 [Flavobacterium arsenatis]|uniref:Transcriptional regulator n=1 Tax=Flavobacterium arsenatis TaxID=1484332 RepID=A0ABU1TQY5_9FLAO|nr:transcriptional regulator [Flavobacterium arsenatis]MDR6968187.1 hypothetical protein [Flavobacterium arsenatis]
MNYIKHLTGFFEKVAIDQTLNPTHISLYIALFQFWNCNRFRNPISISRDEVMRISKISSKATYHKCLKNLHALGYINYQPSYNPFRGSHVILFNFSDDLKPLPKSDRKPNNEPVFESVDKQVLNQPYTSDETGIEQVLVPSINNTNLSNLSNHLNNQNGSNLEKQVKNNEERTDFRMKAEKEKEKKLREKKKDISSIQSITSAQPSNHEKPTIEEIRSYFNENNFPEIEAQKFFNYFSSVGWLVGGKIPMVNWQASAQNWIINAPKFISNTEQPNRAMQLNTATDKDYSEPL